MRHSIGLLLGYTSIYDQLIQWIRDHGRQPVREWPTAIWRALIFPETENI
jgi:hypothetical protein